MPIFFEGILLYSQEELIDRVKQDRLSIDVVTIEQAIQGDPSACYLIGESYIDARNYTKAMSWFILGAQQHHPKCLFMIGYLHERGLCGTTNLEKATDWYIKSVKTNYVQATFQLNMLCKKGYYPKIIAKMIKEIEDKVITDRQNIARFEETYQSRVKENRRLAGELNKKLQGLPFETKNKDMFSYFNEQEKIREELEQLIDEKRQMSQEEAQIDSIEHLVNELKSCAF